MGDGLTVWNAECAFVVGQAGMKTEGRRDHGAEGDQSATNHWLWVQRTVYANKKRLVQERECKGPTECVEGLGRN